MGQGWPAGSVLTPLQVPCPGDFAMQNGAEQGGQQSHAQVTVAPT